MDATRFMYHSIRPTVYYDTALHIRICFLLTYVTTNRDWASNTFVSRSMVDVFDSEKSDRECGIVFRRSLYSSKYTGVAWSVVIAVIVVAVVHQLQPHGNPLRRPLLQSMRERNMAAQVVSDAHVLSSEECV